MADNTKTAEKVKHEVVELKKTNRDAKKCHTQQQLTYSLNFNRNRLELRKIGGLGMISEVTPENLTTSRGNRSDPHRLTLHKDIHL
jgi:hypothetical protein